MPDVNVVGLTLSKNQAAHVQKTFDEWQPAHQAGAAAGLGAVRRAGRPDRVHRRVRAFGHDRYPDFFKMAYGALPEDGIMLLHTIVGEPSSREELGSATAAIGPTVEECSAEGGFTCTRKRSLQKH